MPRKARSLKECLAADDGLARLSHHAWRLVSLQRLFESAFPLAAHARVANLKLGKVIIHADSGGIAAKLRQVAPRLADVFRSEAAEVTGIEIRVQPVISNSVALHKKHGPRVGKQAKQALTSLADGLHESSPLRAALNRLVAKA